MDVGQRAAPRERRTHVGPHVQDATRDDPPPGTRWTQACQSAQDVAAHPPGRPGAPEYEGQLVKEQRAPAHRPGGTLSIHHHAGSSARGEDHEQ
jgi:hypothetical protein